MAEGKSPFSDADFQNILQQERCNSADDGWSQSLQTEGCTVWRKVVPGQTIHLLKAFLDFKGIPAKHLLTLVHDLQVRRRHDEIFRVYDCLEDHGDYRTTYAVIAFPSPLWDRDLVQFNTVRSSDEEHIILYKHATHPSRPVDPAIVRGETIFSGTIIRPMPDDPQSSTATLFLQTDVKGWIPTTIVNLIARTGPAKWQSSLADFYHTTYKKEVESEI